MAVSDLLNALQLRYDQGNVNRTYRDKKEQEERASAALGNVMEAYNFQQAQKGQKSNIYDILSGMGTMQEGLGQPQDPKLRAASFGMLTDSMPLIQKGNMAGVENQTTSSMFESGVLQKIIENETMKRGFMPSAVAGAYPGTPHLGTQTTPDRTWTEQKPIIDSKTGKLIPGAYTDVSRFSPGGFSDYLPVSDKEKAPFLQPAGPSESEPGGGPAPILPPDTELTDIDAILNRMPYLNKVPVGQGLSIAHLIRALTKQSGISAKQRAEEYQKNLKAKQALKGYNFFTP